MISPTFPTRPTRSARRRKCVVKSRMALQRYSVSIEHRHRERSAAKKKGRSSQSILFNRAITFLLFSRCCTLKARHLTRRFRLTSNRYAKRSIFLILRRALTSTRRWRNSRSTCGPIRRWLIRRCWRPSSISTGRDLRLSMRVSERWCWPSAGFLTLVGLLMYLQELLSSRIWWKLLRGAWRST